MEPVEFLKHLCSQAKKSPKFEQEDIEGALAWLDAYDAYRNPTMERLHAMWQLVEDARTRRRKWGKEVRRVRRELLFLRSEMKRTRDILIVDYRHEEGLIKIEAEVKADADPIIKEMRDREFVLIDQLNDRLAAFEAEQQAVKDAKGEYYQVKHDREVLTETGGYHGS
jgi:hypothetical protein